VSDNTSIVPLLPMNSHRQDVVFYEAISCAAANSFLPSSSPVMKSLGMCNRLLNGFEQMRRNVAAHCFGLTSSPP